MSILMNEIRSSLFCFGDSVVTNLHGIGSSIRISHNLNSLDRKISKHPEEKSKVTFDKEVSETVDFEENSNVIKKKPTEEKTEQVEKEKVISEPVKEESKVEEVETSEETSKTESVETAAKSTEEDMPTKSEKTETPEEASKEEPIVEKKPEPAVQQKPKVELKKEDVDKIFNIANFQSKTENKATAAIIANSIINNTINNPNSDLNQKLASNIEQMTKAEEEPIVEKKPEPAVQQKPKVELKKEDVDKIFNFLSKTEYKATAAIIANSIINSIINNQNSDLNQKLASNIEQKPKVELKKEDVDKIFNIANFQSKTENKATAAIIGNSIINSIINNQNSDLNQKRFEY